MFLVMKRLYFILIASFLLMCEAVYARENGMLKHLYASSVTEAYIPTGSTSVKLYPQYVTNSNYTSASYSCIPSVFSNLGIYCLNDETCNFNIIYEEVIENTTMIAVNWGHDGVGMYKLLNVYKHG